jgi:site-specific DNA recombinase
MKQTSRKSDAHVGSMPVTEIILNFEGPARAVRASAAEALRGLIDEIRVTPEDEGHAIEIVGELGALLQLASGNKNAASIHEAARSVKVVAGRGFEPLTFRL